MSGTDSVLVSEIIPASRERIYAAWLDSRQHSAFTGEEARIEPKVCGKHSAFGGYASGRNIELEPGRRIVQTWRSAEFPDGSPDSRVEVTLEETGGGTLVTLLHTEIPHGQADRYREGWLKFYLEPLKRFFARPASNGVNGVNGHSGQHLMMDADLLAGELAEARARARDQASTKPKSKVKAKARAKAKPAARARAGTKVKAKAKTTKTKTKTAAKPKRVAKAKPARAKSRTR